MADNATKSMDEIMALCKRRGFIFQASEIYGGINGFWDYGPLGAQLKKNLRDAWWTDVVMMGAGGRMGPDGKPVEIVPVDTCIIQNPKVWEASGHVGGFNDPMQTCRQCKKLLRADHVPGMLEESEWVREVLEIQGEQGLDKTQVLEWIKKRGKKVAPGLESEPRAEHADVIAMSLLGDDLSIQKRVSSAIGMVNSVCRTVHYEDGEPATRCPYCAGQLTAPRAFNLMFPTVIGATGDAEDNKAYLRPETAQGIFINFKNVVDSTRVALPFGIAQTGKAFRNEVTPRNFTYRSREFEQMEIEFFCHPSESKAWYAFWRDWRMAWWQSLGLAGDNLQLREHDRDELAHYAKEGAGTSDIEYRFPFTAPGFGELEGVADRTDFDLKQHQEHSKKKMEYHDKTRGEALPNGQPKGEWYLPHVIEPSAGLDRGVLALICEAFTPDPDRASGVYMKFHPRIAPIKAAVFPLVKKDGMPEVAEPLYLELRRKFGHLGTIEYDEKQSIGKRYARMDEAGCPFCFTIDSETLTDRTVTVRDRDTQGQSRVAIDAVPAFLAEKLGV